MEHVSIDDVASETTETGAERRSLTEPLGTAHVAINRYVLESGQRFSGSIHAHADQEEVFLVLEGEATFETRSGEVTVGENEAIRFAPGEFQSGLNDGDDRVVALALGAPRESDDVRISRIATMDDGDVSCPDCGLEEMRISREDDVDLVCPDCGAELEVADAD